MWEVVGVSSPVKLDWMVPKTEYDRFRSWVEAKHGRLSHYLGREAEAAMREYADADGYNGVEERVNRLIEASGRTLATVEKEKNPDEDFSETIRATPRVDPDVKDAFREVAKDSDDPMGVEFARAIRTHRQGGRAARLERKLDRVMDDAEALLARVAGDSKKSMSKVEVNTVAIADTLPKQFTDDELETTIMEVANVTSDPTINKYRRRVVERLDMEPHPDNPELWVPTVIAEEFADGAPEECRQPVDILESEDRAKRIQLEVGQLAGLKSSGKCRVKASRIRDEVLDGAVAKSTTHDLMKTAAKAPGIKVDESRSELALKVNLQDVLAGEEDLGIEMLEYRDCEAEGALSRGGKSVTTPSSTPSPAVTDGGED